MAEVADLYVTLRAVTSPFTKAMGESAAKGESFGKSIGGVGGALTKLGQATVIAGVGVAAVSLKMAGDFQASMLRLKTSAAETGDLVGNKLTGNLKLVSQGILKMAVDTATSTKELSSGMYMIESAGFHGAAGLKVLQAAAEGAKAEGADLGTVGNALTTAMKDYHVSASNAIPMMNQLIATVAHGKTTMQDLAGALHSVLPIAAAAGLSYAEVGGAIATMTSHGVTAELATQHLANFIRNLQAPSNVASAEMGRMGLSALDLSQHLGQRGLTGTLNLMMEAVAKHMGPSGLVLVNAFNKSRDAATAAKQMFDAMPKSLQGLATKFEAGKMTAAEWAKTVKALPTDQANLAKQFASSMNRAEGFTTALKNNKPASETMASALKQMSGGAVGLETALQLTGKNAVDFNENVKAISESSKQAGGHVENWAQIQQSFNFKMGQLKEMVQTVAIKIGTVLIPVVMSIVGWFAKHTWAVTALAVVIGGVLVASVIAFTVAIWSMNAALFANPITWIVLAIVAAIALIVVGLMYAWNHFAWFRDAVKGAWDAIRVMTVVAWDVIKAVIVGAVDVLKFVFVGGFDVLKAIVVGVWDGIKAVTTATWHAIQAVILPPLMAIQGVFNAVFNLLKTIVVDTWHIIYAVIFGKTQDVKNAISAFGRDVKAAWSALWNAVKTAVVAVWDAICTVVSFNLTSIWNGVVAAWHGIVAATVATWHAISAAVSASIKGIWTGMQAAWNFIVQLTVNAWNGMLRAISATISGVYKFVSAIPSNILRILGNMGTLLYTVGKNIVVGLWNGLVSMSSWLWNHVFGWIKSVIPGPILHVLGIASPSKLMHSYGQFVAMGLANGIKSQYSAVSDAATGMANIVAGVGESGAFGGTFAVTGTGGRGLPGVSSAGGATVIHNETHVHVAGSVLAEKQLLAIVQKGSLRQNRRNPTNGLAKIGGF